MTMTVKRRKDTSVKKVFQHRIADIRGGVGIKTSELGGDYLFEGTPLGEKGGNGLCSVVKYAIVVTTVAADATTIEVEKGSHFKVGDFVTSDEKKKAYAITAIDKTNAEKDVITIGTTLGESIAVGGFIVQATALASGNTSTLKVTPQSLNGTGYHVKQNDNIFTDAWLIGVTSGNKLPTCIATKLTGIINI
ncbi:MAG: hypothetical protein LBG18_01915 [Mediterranea sp.]|jgi:hypothetical protein|nr:hypothetical protein [Mediterranea sp.]